MRTRNQLGRRFTRNQRGRDDDIDFTGLARKQLHLRSDEFFAHNLGIAALACAILLEIELEEFGIHTLDLFLDFGAGIEGAYDRAQRLGGADGRKPGDTCTDDQHLGRIDLAGRGNLAGEETTELMRGLDDRTITGDICHRTERIEFLRARNPRNRVHRQHRRLAFGEMLQQFLILRGPDETDQVAPSGINSISWRPSSLLNSGGRTLRIRSPAAQADSVSRAISAPFSRNTSSPNIGAGSGTRFDDHLEPGLDQLADHFRRGGNSLFTAMDFSRYCYFHIRRPGC